MQHCSIGTELAPLGTKPHEILYDAGAGKEPRLARRYNAFY